MRFLRLAAAAVAASTFAILIPAAATAASTGDTTSGVDAYQSRQTDKQIRDFWTPARMRGAILNPVEAPVATPDRGRRVVTAATAHRQQTASAPPSGFFAEDAATQARADWPTISVSVERPADDARSYQAVGRLFFTLPNGDPKFCSATSIVSANKNTIWTAAHCVHRGDGSGDAGWTENLMYVPGYQYGAEPIGEWTAAFQRAPSAWTEDGDTKEADMAAIVLNSHPVHGTLENAVGGALGYQFADNATDHAEVALFGYAIEGYNRSDLDGERQMGCAGSTTDASYLNPFDDRLKIDCDMGDGASGGPFARRDSVGTRIVGVISHHEADATTQKRISDDLFSSEHGTYAAAVINAVNSA